MIPVGPQGELRNERQVRASIPARWSGWITLGTIEATGEAHRFRIVFPEGRPPYQMGGVVFGEDGHRWPWAQKTSLILMAKNPETGRVELNFDPAALLPWPLNQHAIEVVEDGGSSVLLQIDRR
jgi:hypothetical protein